MRRLTMVFMASIFSIGCQPDENSVSPQSPDGIVGGSLELPPDDPGALSVASLHFQMAESSKVKIKDSRCSGALIRPNAILTAAHCVTIKGKPPLHFEGFAYFPQTRDSLKIVAAVAHPKFKSKVVFNDLGEKIALPEADLALVFLETEAEAPLRPASLFNELLPAGSSIEVRSYGYGAVSDLQGASSNFISDLKPTLIKNDLLLRWVDLRGLVEPQSIRFDQSVGKGFCKGDSGGPQFARSTETAQIVAVHSAISKFDVSSNLDRCRQESVAILTTPYQDWILETLETFQP